MAQFISYHRMQYNHVVSFYVSYRWKVRVSIRFWPRDASLCQHQRPTVGQSGDNNRVQLKAHSNKPKNVHVRRESLQQSLKPGIQNRQKPRTPWLPATLVSSRSDVTTDDQRWPVCSQHNGQLCVLTLRESRGKYVQNKASVKAERNYVQIKEFKNVEPFQWFQIVTTFGWNLKLSYDIHLVQPAFVTYGLIDWQLSNIILNVKTNLNYTTDS